MTENYLRNIVNAVSAGFICREDTYSCDPYAKIRVAAGLHFYREKVSRDFAVLDFAYSAVAAVITGAGAFSDESFNEYNDAFYRDYKRLHSVLRGVKYAKEDGSVPGNARILTQEYNYLFG